MALHVGGIASTIVYEATTAVSNIDSDFLQIQGRYGTIDGTSQEGMWVSTSGVNQTFTSNGTVGLNYDEVSSSTIQTASVIRSYRLGDTMNHGIYPYGLLVKKPLMPGETLTISFYLAPHWQMNKDSFDGNRVLSTSTRVTLRYENRPGQIESFMSNPAAATASIGVGEIQTSNGTNVGVIKPWSYSSGHDYYDFKPCLGGPQDHSGGGASYLGSGTSVYGVNPAIMSSRLYFKANVPDSKPNYERYYSITVSNDSGFPAAIRICPETDFGVSGREAMNFHRITLKCEKRSQFLPGPIITGRGDLSANGSNFYLGANAIPDSKPVTSCQPIPVESFNSYSYKIVPINCNIEHASSAASDDEFFALPIGGLYSFADGMTSEATGDVNTAGISPFASNFIAAPFDGTIVGASFCLERSMGGSGIITLKLVKLSEERESNSEVGGGSLDTIESVSFTGRNGNRQILFADDLADLKFSKNDYIALLAKFGSMPTAGPGGILGSILIRYKD